MDDHILSSIQLPIAMFPAVAYLPEQLVAGFVFSSLYFNNKKRNLLLFLDGVGIWLLLSHSRIITALLSGTGAGQLAFGFLVIFFF